MWLLTSLLPLWEKVARTQSVPDEGVPQNSTPPPPVSHLPRRATLSHKGRGEGKLPRRHADGAVEADGLAVEHRVLDDVHREVAVFGSIAESRRMRHLRAKALACIFT